jgi:hypothetical protein
MGCAARSLHEVRRDAEIAAMDPGQNFAPDFWVAMIAILVALFSKGMRRPGIAPAGLISVWWTSTLILSIWVLAIDHDSPAIREAVAISVALLIVEAVIAATRPRISKNFATS